MGVKKYFIESADTKASTKLPLDALFFLENYKIVVLEVVCLQDG
jgi:hypothetical protein